MKKSFCTNPKKVCLYTSLYFFLGLFFSGIAFAQEPEGGGGTGLSIKFGAKFGTTLNSFSNEQPHNNITQGLTGGIFANYQFNENMGVQVEALYAQEGGRLLYFDLPHLIGQDNWYVVDAENQQVVLHNINLPVLFNYTLKFNNFNLGAYIGPDFGYTMKAIAYKEGTVITDFGGFHTYTGNKDVSSDIEDFNIAGTAGIGIEIPVGKFNLLIDGRYRYGITQIYKSYSYVGIPQITGDLRNHSMFLTIGIGF